MTDENPIERYRNNLQGEVDGAYLYNALAEAEKNSSLAKVYRDIAAVEMRHGQFWADQITKAGATPPRLHPSWRARTLATLAKFFGPKFVLPTVAAMESTDSSGYAEQPESRDTNLPADEASHRRLVEAILDGSNKGMEGETLAKLEGRHRQIGGNALRAAVLGANDGLVSNLSLVMGVAGAELSNQTILITGFAGLLAGAISMALGEWLSVQSSRELYERQIAIEKDELEANPKEEEEELALIYQAKGLGEKQAKALAAKLISNRATALDTLTREELGINPKDLGGSPWVAAASSFFLFVIGAIFPVLPFVFTSGVQAVGVSIALSAVILFVIGGLITLLTGKNLFLSGFRQLVFGLSAAAITYGIGRLLGVTIAG